MTGTRQTADATRALQRVAACAVAVVLGFSTEVPLALAITPPPIEPALVPADGRPGPEQAMRQSNLCADPIALPDPAIGLPAPGFAMLNIRQAWRYSTGNGVPVAVIDTGVHPHPRLPVVAGGDYIVGGDGLTDCDAHGTVIASLIAAAPQGSPMPPPMPPTSTESGLGAAAPSPPQSSPSAPAAADGVVGVAPHATLISIRQSSRAYSAVDPGPRGSEARAAMATLARAIVHAANLGARVINVSVAACVPAAEPLDQRALGAAVWYAAMEKDAVIVAAAGNEGENGCVQNPLSGNPAGDSRDWQRVRTVSSPSWYSDYVLSVGAVDTGGAPISKSLAGPWVGVAAPGVGIVGLSPRTGSPVNAYPPPRPGEAGLPFWGTSYSAAYVSGVAALVRAKYPELSARDVIARIVRTAHNPARGADSRVGYGMVDPVAALTFNVQPGGLTAAGARVRVLNPPPAPPSPDHRARHVALGFAAAIVAALLLALGIVRAGRAR